MVMFRQMLLEKGKRNSFTHVRFEEMNVSLMTWFDDLLPVLFKRKLQEFVLTNRPYCCLTEQVYNRSTYSLNWTSVSRETS